MRWGAKVTLVCSIICGIIMVIYGIIILLSNGDNAIVMGLSNIFGGVVSILVGNYIASLLLFIKDLSERFRELENITSKTL